MFLTTGKPKHPKLCEVLNCRRLRSHLNSNGVVSRVCSRCQTTRWRINNPLHAKWKAIKDKAKRRKVSFEVTLEEFMGFCQATGYASRCGRMAADLHVDRKDALIGYRLDNLRVLTCADNSSKGAGFDKAAYAAQRRGEPLYRQAVLLADNDADPF